MRRKLVSEIKRLFAKREPLNLAAAKRRRGVKWGSRKTRMGQRQSDHSVYIRGPSDVRIGGMSLLRESFDVGDEESELVDALERAAFVAWVLDAHRSPFNTRTPLWRKLETDYVRLLEKAQREVARLQKPRGRA